MRIFILICVIFVSVRAYTRFDYEDGWTPISDEEAYRRLNLNVPKPKNIQRIDHTWFQNMELTTENSYKNKIDAINVVEPQHVYKSFQVKMFGLPASSNYAKDDENDTDDVTQSKTEISTVKTLRRAKKIDDRNYIVSAHNLVKEEAPNTVEENDDIKTADVEDTQENVETVNYEVVEKPGATNTNITKINTKVGYLYSPPKVQQVQNNFTNIFKKILSKYNIGSEDKLTNYEKSRVSNGHTISKSQIIYLPIPIQNLQRYNSLNHLSVDPMLAVFLANYGHYLPYSYGIHNNYRNLYGYLASNNIHNNNPFGSYKLFSDTDSSN